MLVNQVIAYETGEMDMEETISFFQGIIDTGVVWSLQGHYARTAQHLIETGMCTPSRIAKRTVSLLDLDADALPIVPDSEYIDIDDPGRYVNRYDAE